MLGITPNISSSGEDIAERRRRRYPYKTRSQTILTINSLFEYHLFTAFLMVRTILLAPSLDVGAYDRTMVQIFPSFFMNSAMAAAMRHPAFSEILILREPKGWLNFALHEIGAGYVGRDNGGRCYFSTSQMLYFDEQIICPCPWSRQRPCKVDQISLDDFSQWKIQGRAIRRKMFFLLASFAAFLTEDL